MPTTPRYGTRLNATERCHEVYDRQCPIDRDSDVISRFLWADAEFFGQPGIEAEQLMNELNHAWAQAEAAAAAEPTITISEPVPASSPYRDMPGASYYAVTVVIGQASRIPQTHTYIFENECQVAQISPHADEAAVRQYRANRGCFCWASHPDSPSRWHPTIVEALNLPPAAVAQLVGLWDRLFGAAEPKLLIGLLNDDAPLADAAEVEAEYRATPSDPAQCTMQICAVTGDHVISDQLGRFIARGNRADMEAQLTELQQLEPLYCEGCGGAVAGELGVLRGELMVCPACAAATDGGLLSFEGADNNDGGDEPPPAAPVAVRRPPPPPDDLTYAYVTVGRRVVTGIMLRSILHAAPERAAALLHELTVPERERLTAAYAHATGLSIPRATQQVQDAMSLITLGTAAERIALRLQAA